MKKLVLATAISVASFSASAVTYTTEKYTQPAQFGFTFPTNTYSIAYDTIGAASGAAGVDVYQYTCPVSTGHVLANVMDRAPLKPSTISVQAISYNGKIPMPGSLAVDKVDSDNGRSFPSIANVYTSYSGYIYIKKSAYTGGLTAYKGAENYKLSVGCFKIAGITGGASHYEPAILKQVTNQ